MRCFAIVACLFALAVTAPALAEDPAPAPPPAPELVDGKTAAEWQGEFVRMRRLAYRRLKQTKNLRVILRARLRDEPATSLEAAFLCIHKYERGAAGWATNTGNGYFGGLQMDRSFMRSYGPEFVRAWGFAHRWPSSVQLTVGMRAYLSGRGFHPWPNTARDCGLL